MRETLRKRKPDLVLVHGDTTTTFASSLHVFIWALKWDILKRGSVLTIYRLLFPEEFNRQSTGIIADYHFAPTDLSRKNLLAEGKDKHSIIVTGNTVIDALHLVLKRIDADKNKSKEIAFRFNQRLSFDYGKPLVLF